MLLARTTAALFCALISARASDAPRMLLLDAARSGADVVVVGERGAILRSTDNARTWTAASAPTRTTLTGVTFVRTNPSLGWAVGHDATILATRDGGGSWTRQFQGEDLQESFLDVVALDVQHAIAVGAYGLYFSTEDAGRTWTRRKLSADDYHFNRITRAEDHTLYIAGEHGTLLRSTDNGATWQAIPTPYEGSFFGVIPLGGRAVLAHGLRGHLFWSDSSGARWHPVRSPIAALLATGLRTGSVVVVSGHARTLLVSTDGGSTFTSSPHALPTAIAELIELADGRILAVGEAGASLLPPL